MREIQGRLLARAIEIAGGSSKLCDSLGVEEHALNLWLAGRATPPQRIFLALVDIVLADDLNRAAQDRRRAPREDIQASAR
jgi:DNA-binding transcriptional regulator YdaS (Cro superfamily)